MLTDTKRAKEIIARRVARELRDGDVVNLGIGVPTLVPRYADPSLLITLQSENGMLGMGETPEPIDPDMVDAGGEPVSVMQHGCFFDSALSFGMIRGGHVDIAVLGALEVDETGSIANWIIPGKKVPGMGGAMDLLTGARRIIVAMLHTAGGRPRIVKRCTLPLSAKRRVDLLVTEMGVMEVVDGRLVLKEIFSHTSLEEIKKCTGADLVIAPDLKTIEPG